MTEKFGPDWIKKQAGEFRKEWENTKQKRLKEGQSERPSLIWYSQLGDLLQIIVRRNHFELFKPVFLRPESVQEAIARLLPPRHAVAHVGVITQLDVLTVSAETLRILHAIRMHEED